MELIIAFVVGMALLVLGAESESLREYSERQHVNRMADRSRKAQKERRWTRYALAGWRPGR